MIWIWMILSLVFLSEMHWSFVFVCVCSYVHMHESGGMLPCVCVWAHIHTHVELEVDIRCLPQSLSTFETRSLAEPCSYWFGLSVWPERPSIFLPLPPCAENISIAAMPRFLHECCDFRSPCLWGKLLTDWATFPAQKCTHSIEWSCMSSLNWSP